MMPGFGIGFGFANAVVDLGPSDVTPPVVTDFVVSNSDATHTTVRADCEVEPILLRFRYALTTKSSYPVAGWTAWSDWFINDPYLGATGVVITHGELGMNWYIHIEADIEDAAGNPASGNPYYGTDQYTYIPEE